MVLVDKDNNKKVIGGIAAVINSVTDLGYFEEVIEAGAFDYAMKARVVTMPSEWAAMPFKRDMRISPVIIPNGVWLGKKHNQESKLKMSNSHKGKHDGELNSQYGTIWITNGKENKKIKTYEEIPNGWEKGRVLKNARRII